MRLKQFQLEDYARAACHDGLILAHDTGCGKTWATYLWPLLKTGYEFRAPGSEFNPKPETPNPQPELRPKAPVLIVAPGDLHRQICEEGWTKFRIRTTPIDKPTFRRLCPDGRTLAPGFYITSYTDLGQNNTLFPPNLEKATEPKLLAFFNSLPHPLTPSPAIVAGGQVSKWAGELLAGTVADRSAEGTPPARAVAGRASARCVVDPTFADEAANVFACVVVDEGVRVKGDYTLIAEGVRTLDPDYRLVLTATPIKNRLPDLFWLMQWATGGRPAAHARFPYAGTTEAKGDFSGTFLVQERNLSKERQAAAGQKKKRSYVRLRAEVCNVHRLWKLCAPIVLRRRKQDTGMDLVTKHRHVVRVPLGREQAACYEYHLEAHYVDKNMKPAPGAQMQALRVAAAHPSSALLQQKDTDHLAVGPLDAGTPFQSDDSGTRARTNPAARKRLPYRSSKPYTPKMAAVLELIAQCLERREQVIVGCALHDPNDYLESLLRVAGVPCAKLDGRVSPARRGELAAWFKAGPQVGRCESGQGGEPHPLTGSPAHPLPVLLAGVECMAEGHSFDQCPNAILPAFSWAYDKFEQFINRIHRMTSRKPVNVWSVICTGTADRKLEASISEKGDAAALVLDGCLSSERTEEVNLAELLRQARLEFEEGAKCPSGRTVCELELAKSWPALRARLATAWAAWGGAPASSTASPAAGREGGNVSPTHPHNPSPAHSVVPWRQRFLRRT